MNNYKVSILIPVYNVSKYIERCAHSVFSQTFSNIEFVFVDDCSPDKSIEILEKTIELYPRRKDSVTIIKHTINKGVGIARKTAFDASTGDFILYIDSDDYIEIDMVELLINEVYLKNSDIVFCSIVNEYSNGKSKIIKHIYSSNKSQILKRSFSQPSLCNKMFRRDIITKNNIEFFKNINYGEDLSLTPRIIYYSERFSVVDKALYHYVQYNTDSFTAKFTENSLKDTLKAIELLNDFFVNKPDYQKYKRILATLKAVRKAKILRSGRINKQYLELFPEINSAIIILDLDIKTKIILLLAAFHQQKFLRMYVDILLKRKFNKE